jgi:hypothetical protein
MKTAIPDILRELGESEYTVLSSAYCKLHEVRDYLTRMHDVYLRDGVPPTFSEVAAVRILTEEVFGEVEKYVLALADPGEDVCLNYRKAA